MAEASAGPSPRGARDGGHRPGVLPAAFLPRAPLRDRVGAGRSLNTWSKRGRFTYQGDLTLGTRVLHGRDQAFVVPADVYARLLAHFAGKTVEIGASRRPPRGSLGSWLQAQLGIELAVAYVGPILVAEKAAVREKEAELRFFERNTRASRGDSQDS